MEEGLKDEKDLHIVGMHKARDIFSFAVFLAV